MDIIFQIVYTALKWISLLTGFTYNEINIIVYYIIIPFIFLHQLDKLFRFHYLKIGFALFTFLTILLVDDFEVFSNWLFQKSVDFLKWFDLIGLNYVQASVVICVFLPILIYFGLRRSTATRTRK